MEVVMSDANRQRRLFAAATGVWLSGLSWLSGCSSTKVAQKPPAPNAPPLSHARSEREYRADVARHLYQRNTERIYQGKLPPMLYAIGVTRLSIAANGDVLDIDWMRKPSHAPEVVAEIERTIRAAAPLPVASAVRPLIYTETWLWHKSGRFQLDTLTEGQT
jgi:protein TonB